MKTIAKLSLALALAVGLAAAATAGDETTVSGQVMCAKCSLKKADADKCQDVLVTKDDSGNVTEYYIEKTEAARRSATSARTRRRPWSRGRCPRRTGRPGSPRRRWRRSRARAPRSQTDRATAPSRRSG